jgi:hypothetical protein
MNKNKKMMWAVGIAVFHAIATYALQYVGAIAYAQEPNALPILATFLQLPGVVVASLVCMIWGSITPTSSCGVAWPWIVYPANLVIIYLIAKCWMDRKGRK